jgi:hypothetical protein
MKNVAYIDAEYLDPVLRSSGYKSVVSITPEQRNKIFMEDLHDW